MTHYMVYSGHISASLIYRSLDKAMAKMTEIMEKVPESDYITLENSIHIIKCTGDPHPFFDEDTQSIRKPTEVCQNCGSSINPGTVREYSNGKPVCEQCILEARRDKYGAREV